MTSSEALKIYKQNNSRTPIAMYEMKNRFIIQYGSGKEIDPFIAIDKKTGEVSDFTPAEDLSFFSAREIKLRKG